MFNDSNIKRLRILFYILGGGGGGGGDLHASTIGFVSVSQSSLRTTIFLSFKLIPSILTWNVKSYILSIAGERNVNHKDQKEL